MNKTQQRGFRSIVFVLLFGVAFFFLPPSREASATTGFVTRSGTQLMLNGSAFRFSGANIYWLGLDENVGGYDYPTSFRVDDALDTVSEMGGTVVRTFAALSVGCAKCIEPSQGIFNETALTKLDYVVKAAGDRNIRLILPLVDAYQAEASYHGWTGTYRGWISGSGPFYTDPAVINLFEGFISTILNRVNTLTGVAYKNDPTILAWETGNELPFAPVGWTETIASYIKTIDGNHLVLDGEWQQAAPFINSAAFSLVDVDMYSDHFYPMNVARLSSDASTVSAAGKVFYVGEYGWNMAGGDTLSDFIAAIETGSAKTTVGDSFWSLFPHLDTYGYVAHMDTSTASYALHYPGLDSASPGTPDMRERAQSLRNHAYSMSSLATPADGTPGTPLITNITNSAVISWRGAAIADKYTVERATAGSSGPWTVVCPQCATDYNTPWTDTTATVGSAWYRVKGYNLSGAIAGGYSPVVQATISGSVMVDDLNDWTKTYSHTSNLIFDSTNASYLGGDTSRVARTTSTNEAIVWNKTGTTSFQAVAYFWPNEAVSHFSFYTSANGSSFTQVTPTITGGTGNWKQYTYTIGGLSNVNFVKVMWNNTTGTNWTPQLSDVTITYKDGNPAGTGLQINVTNDGSATANRYIYKKVSGASYTFQVGDYIEYDVKLQNAIGGAGGIDIQVTTGAAFRSAAGWVDQYGVNGHPGYDISPYAYTEWFHRKLAVPASMIGKAAQYWLVAGENDTASFSYGAQYDNIVVTNGAAVMKIVFASSGDYVTTGNLLTAGVSSSSLTTPVVP